MTDTDTDDGPRTAWGKAIERALNQLTGGRWAAVAGWIQRRNDRIDRARAGGTAGPELAVDKRGGGAYRTAHTGENA